MVHAAKPTTFNPVAEARSLGAVSQEVGINWSYATFDKEDAVAIFISRCNQNGYRVRNEEITSKGHYSVQYHMLKD